MKLDPPIPVNDLHADYLSIYSMNSSHSVKDRMLTYLFSDWKHGWRVVGITPAALLVFAEHDFRYASKMGINRSHLIDRKMTHNEMLHTPIMDAQEWWDYFVDRDRTILATSKENMSGKELEYIPITETELFSTRGFAWKHNKEEQEYLRRLHSEL